MDSDAVMLEDSRVINALYEAATGALAWLQAEFPEWREGDGPFREIGALAHAIDRAEGWSIEQPSNSKETDDDEELN